MSTLAQTRKARPADEWFSERVFRPLAQKLVDPAANLRLKPEGVVLFHTGLGLVAAWQIAYGRSLLWGRISPAVLLQIKTTLDGLDGQLARATNQTSDVGRYLDSEMDVVVNAALLCAVLGVPKGLAANLLLSLILTTDFLWERDHREARGEEFRADPAISGEHPRLLRALQGFYDGYFLPQEQLLGGLFRARLRAVSGGSVSGGGVSDADAVPTPAQRLAYTPKLLNAVSVNLGLATQLVALGACVLAGRPRLYPASLLAQAGVLAGLQFWREGQVRQQVRPGAHLTRRQSPDIPQPGGTPTR
ncbi:CDP-alcohol phosphatidyltransferase family protein [Deinococcus altitudinis]|uniref:CDP-alcohol phosphatidyltransferase family protein n=1 Tax=Deinococcus altitudinis TaxID=468914 RepID=UPI0038911AC2